MLDIFLATKCVGLKVFIFIHQVKIACDMIKADEKFKDGYHALGFSQGGLFMLVEMTLNERLRTLLIIPGAL